MRPIAVLEGPVSAPVTGSSAVLNGGRSTCPSGTCRYVWGVTCPGGRSWTSTTTTPTASVPLSTHARAGVVTAGLLAPITCNVTLTLVDRASRMASAASAAQLTVGACYGASHCAAHVASGLTRRLQCTCVHGLEHLSKHNGSRFLSEEASHFAPMHAPRQVPLSPPDCGAMALSTSRFLVSSAPFACSQQTRAWRNEAVSGIRTVT